VGTNGVGKSTALKILAGKIKPNLGNFDVVYLEFFKANLITSFLLIKAPPDWQEILTHFRGSELQSFFTHILQDEMKALIKPQYVDHIPKGCYTFLTGA
jgi:ATP-binding cassette subfamily E protein 1